VPQTPLVGDRPADPAPRPPTRRIRLRGTLPAPPRGLPRADRVQAILDELSRTGTLRGRNWPTGVDATTRRG
jgi:hypothetical protein